MKFLLHLSPKATGLLRTSREPFTAEGRSEEPWRKPGFGKKENRELDPRPPGSHFLQGLCIPDREDPAEESLGGSEREGCPRGHPLPTAPGPPCRAARWPSAGREASVRKLGRLEALREEAQAFGEGLTLKVNVDPGKLPLVQVGAQLESEPPTDHPLHR